MARASFSGGLRELLLYVGVNLRLLRITNLREGGAGSTIVDGKSHSLPATSLENTLTGTAS